ncbi:hypothetical protein, partial [Nocardia cyriacigeorgica]|uniref:hypothetical protein n=1 Tax=Nocardia cyriacigeorgica TaxID=135487 RepID=UPI0024553ABB
MIGKFEANKDLIQELTSSGARHVGNIATIITGTVQEVTREIGEWITDAIEMNEAAAAAKRDAAAETVAARAGAAHAPPPAPRGGARAPRVAAPPAPARGGGGELV